MGGVVERRRPSLSPSPATTLTGRPQCLLLVYLCGAILAPSSAHNVSSVTSAMLFYSYTDLSSGDTAHDEAVGAYGHGSLVRNTSGLVTHVQVGNGTHHHGCSTYVNTPTHTHHYDVQPWVALVQRGQCTFQQKIDMADLHNATAIVIYNIKQPETNGEIEVMNHAPTMLTAVLIDHIDGEKLVKLVDSGVSVHMDIAVGNTITPNPPKPAASKKHTTAVLLVFVGFLILGLIVVVVYAVRHAKYVHSRNQNNLTISLGQARQGQETLLNNVSTPPGHPPPPHTDVPALCTQQPLQVQALLPQIQEEDEQQQQNHQQLDLGDQSLDQRQNSPLLPH